MSFLLTGTWGMPVCLGAQDQEISQKPGPRFAGEISIGQNKENFRVPLGKAVRTSSGIVYALLKEIGFVVSFDSGQTWFEQNQGLPRKVVHPFPQDTGTSGSPVRSLTSLGVDPLNEGRVAVTTTSELYLSENYGATWENIPLGKFLSSSSYLTSVALSPEDRYRLLVGTSFNGFYETRDRGRSWQNPSCNIRFIYRGAGFYEEISGISYHPENQEVILFSCGFGHGIYMSSNDRKSWARLDFPSSTGLTPGSTHNEIIQQLQFKQGNNGKGWLLEVKTQNTSWHYTLHDQHWRLIEKTNPSEDADPFRQERIRRASNKFGIYVSSLYAQGEELDNHLNFLTEHGLNAMVVDLKDDYGWVTYDTRLELPYRIGAVNTRIELEQLLKKAHKRGIYVIARLVVFKDRQLYNYADHKYAVWNRNTDRPWRYLVKIEDEKIEENGERREARFVQNEYWVDPYSSFVWNYNLALAKELQQRGVDEIQFDYIRFPSDGTVSEIKYRYKRENMTRIDALESFLIIVRESIHIPLSTDLYGFNSWHRMGNWIGQSIEMLADYADVICPMFYPSHFPKEFIEDKAYLLRAKQIYWEGTSRAESIVGKRSIVRPYIQAFLIGGELKMSTQEYSSYLINQIEGTIDAPSSGFTLWNASNRYYMVRVSLKSFLPSREELHGGKNQNLNGWIP